METDIAAGVGNRVTFEVTISGRSVTVFGIVQWVKNEPLKGIGVAMSKSLRDAVLSKT